MLTNLEESGNIINLYFLVQFLYLLNYYMYIVFVLLCDADGL